MRTLGLVASIVLFAATSAQAVFVGFDVGANNSFATANALVSDDLDFNACDLSADVGLGSLAAGDMDFYSVVLPDGCILTAITTPLSPYSTTPDTIMGVFDAGGIIVGNDDAGGSGDSGGPVTNFGSAVRYLNDTGAAQLIALGVTGFADFYFTGAHAQAGLYTLTVSVIPEPVSIGLVALGALALIRRRK